MRAKITIFFNLKIYLLGNHWGLAKTEVNLHPWGFLLKSSYSNKLCEIDITENMLFAQLKKCGTPVPQKF
jgi:hypothetical protein